MRRFVQERRGERRAQSLGDGFSFFVVPARVRESRVENQNGVARWCF